MEAIAIPANHHGHLGSLGVLHGRSTGLFASGRPPILRGRICKFFPTAYTLPGNPCLPSVGPTVAIL
jgi:hypothetical protein